MNPKQEIELIQAVARIEGNLKAEEKYKKQRHDHLDDNLKELDKKIAKGLGIVHQRVTDFEVKVEGRLARLETKIEKALKANGNGGGNSHVKAAGMGGLAAIGGIIAGLGKAMKWW